MRKKFANFNKLNNQNNTQQQYVQRELHINLHKHIPYSNFQEDEKVLKYAWCHLYKIILRQSLLT